MTKDEITALAEEAGIVVTGEAIYTLCKLVAQRTWAGLTDEDRLELAAAQHGWEDLLIAAETKLKEKNA